MPTPPEGAFLRAQTQNPSLSPSTGSTATLPSRQGPIERDRSRNFRDERPPVSDLRTTGQRLLFVASTGGHLTELHRLSKGMDVRADSSWLTFDTPQSRSLLQGQSVHHVPYVAPRDGKAALVVAREMWRLLQRERYDHVVSTGAAVAVPAFAVAALMGMRRTYIESVARVTSLSLTGRIVDATRLAALRTQHEVLPSSRWRRHASVLTEFESVARRGRPTGTLKVFVTLGTIHPYRFDSVVDALLLAARDRDISFTWQLGDTVRDDLPGEVHTLVDADTFRRLAADADIVVTHAGVGTLLELYDLGIYPVIVPRRGSRGEHVDDHQVEIATYAAEQDLGVVADGPDLRLSHLAIASRRAVRERQP